LEEQPAVGHTRFHEVQAGIRSTQVGG